MTAPLSATVCVFVAQCEDLLSRIRKNKNENKATGTFTIVLIEKIYRYFEFQVENDQILLLVGFGSHHQHVRCLIGP